MDFLKSEPLWDDLTCCGLEKVRAVCSLQVFFQLFLQARRAESVVYSYRPWPISCAYSACGRATCAANWVWQRLSTRALSLSASTPRTISPARSKWICRGRFLNYTQAVFMCVQLRELTEVRDLLLSTLGSPPSKQRAAHRRQRSGLALSAYTHWGPRLRATLHPGPPLWFCRTEALWWGTSPGSCWGIRRLWLGSRRTQICRIPKDDSLRSVWHQVIIQVAFHCSLKPLRVTLSVWNLLVHLWNDAIKASGCHQLSFRLMHVLTPPVLSVA